jgi:hypothetical protein
MSIWLGLSSIETVHPGAAFIFHNFLGQSMDLQFKAMFFLMQVRERIPDL